MSTNLEEINGNLSLIVDGDFKKPQLVNDNVSNILNAHKGKKVGEFVRGIGKINDIDLEKCLSIHKDTGEQIGNILVNENHISIQELVNYLKILGVSPKLGEMLCAEGIINLNQLEKALEDQKKIKLLGLNEKSLHSNSGSLLGAILVEKKYISEETLLQFLSRQKKVNYVYGGDNVNLGHISREIYGIYNNNREDFELFKCLPISVYGDILVIAMLNPSDESTISEIAHITKKSIIPVLTEPQSYKRIKKDFYKTGFSNDLKDTISEIILHAILVKSSDIHFLPTNTGHDVYLRIDGDFIKKGEISAVGGSTLVGIMRNNCTSMNTMEINKPQNGVVNQEQMELQGIFGHNTDIRVALNPALNGYEVVMRVIDNSLGEVSIEDLNMSFALQDIIKRLSKSKQSLTIYSGSTGGGKSTSQRAWLNLFNGKKVSIEQPAEVKMKGVVQYDVKEGVTTFIDYLKAAFRADINALSVGEIRDGETASIALQGANSGHHVASSVHSNNSLSTITRLLDLGVDKSSLTDSLRLSIHQGLIKKLCPSCKKKINLPSADRLSELGIQEQIIEHMIKNEDRYNVCKPVGCSDCQNTGYKGRIGVFEFFVMTQGIKEYILNTKELNINEILRMAREQYNMTTFYEEVLRNVIEGNVDICELEAYNDFTGSYDYIMKTPEQIIESSILPFKLNKEKK